jgi:hypothetical protein
MNYRDKYFKYKNKYLILRNQLAGKRGSLDVMPKFISRVPAHELQVLKTKSSYTKSDMLDQTATPFVEPSRKNTDVLKNEPSSHSKSDMLLQKVSLLENEPYKNKFKELSIQSKDISFLKLDTSSEKAIINSNFIALLLNDQIKYELAASSDNPTEQIITFIIDIFPYNRISIYDNTLSLPGLSIKLQEHMDNNIDVPAIRELIKDRLIKSKHVIDMPLNTKVNGILLSNLLELIDERNINSNEFNIKVNFAIDPLYEKLLAEYKSKMEKNKIDNAEKNVNDDAGIDTD